MRRLAFMLLVAGCATPPPPAPDVSPAAVTAEWDTRVDALRECYRDYVLSFGGTPDDGEMRPSRRGPSVADDMPFQGEVVFRVEIVAAGVESSAEPQPDEMLVACWSDVLERDGWPAEPPATVTRAMMFDIVPAD